MPRTADHIAATHMIAHDRRQAGKPVWDEIVRLGHIWQNDDLNFEQVRDQTVARLRTTAWFQNADEFEFDGVHEIIDYHLANAEDAEEFDGWWDELYDHADYARVFIDVYN